MSASERDNIDPILEVALDELDRDGESNHTTSAQFDDDFMDTFIPEDFYDEDNSAPSDAVDDTVDDADILIEAEASVRESDGLDEFGNSESLAKNTRQESETNSSNLPVDSITYEATPEIDNELHTEGDIDTVDEFFDDFDVLDDINHTGDNSNVTDGSFNETIHTEGELNVADDFLDTTPHTEESPSIPNNSFDNNETTEESTITDIDDFFNDPPANLSNNNDVMNESENDFFSDDSDSQAIEDPHNLDDIFGPIDSDLTLIKDEKIPTSAKGSSSETNEKKGSELDDFDVSFIQTSPTNNEENEINQSIQGVEDLENFLNSLPISDTSPNKTVDELDRSTALLLHSRSPESSNQSEPEAAKQEENTTEKSAPSIEQKRKPKFSLLVSILATGLLCSTVATYSTYFVVKNHTPSDTTQRFEEMKQETRMLESQLTSLKDTARQIETLIGSMEGRVSSIEFENQKLTLAQELLKNEHAELSKELSSLKNNASEYEVAMIERLESLLLFTRGLSQNLSEQESRIRDSVFKETIAAIEAKQGQQGNTRLNDVIKALQDNNTKLGQIESTLLSQKTLLSLIGDETEYLKTRVADVERGNFHQNSSTSHSEAASPTNAPPVSVQNPATSQKKPEQAGGYMLIGVLQKSPGVFEIYLQHSSAKSATEYETYIFSPSEKSVVPGLGLITGVQGVPSTSSVVPYQIITESGVIKGRQR